MEWKGNISMEYGIIEVWNGMEIIFHTSTHLSYLLVFMLRSCSPSRLLSDSLTNKQAIAKACYLSMYEKCTPRANLRS